MDLTYFTISDDGIIIIMIIMMASLKLYFYIANVCYRYYRS